MSQPLQEIENLAPTMISGKSSPKLGHRHTLAQQDSHTSDSSSELLSASPSYTNEEWAPAAEWSTESNAQRLRDTALVKPPSVGPMAPYPIGDEKLAAQPWGSKMRKIYSDALNRATNTSKKCRL